MITKEQFEAAKKTRDEAIGVINQYYTEQLDEAEVERIAELGASVKERLSAVRILCTHDKWKDQFCPACLQDHLAAIIELLQIQVFLWFPQDRQKKIEELAADADIDPQGKK
jgi:N-acetylmuramoyl-L-alanine amidase CwlA